MLAILPWYLFFCYISSNNNEIIKNQKLSDSYLTK